MHAELEDWKNGWFGVRLSLRPTELARLIALLQKIQADPDQHFHLTSTHKDIGGLGDIEISMADDHAADNMVISGLALGPGDNLPE